MWKEKWSKVIAWCCYAAADALVIFGGAVLIGALWYALFILRVIS